MSNLNKVNKLIEKKKQNLSKKLPRTTMMLHFTRGKDQTRHKIIKSWPTGSFRNDSETFLLSPSLH